MINRKMSKRGEFSYPIQNKILKNNQKKFPKVIWITPLILAILALAYRLIFFLINSSKYTLISYFFMVMSFAILGVLAGLILNKKINYWIKGAILGGLYPIINTIGILSYSYLGTYVFHYASAEESSFLVSFILSFSRYVLLVGFYIALGTLIGGTILLFKNKRYIIASILSIPIIILLIFLVLTSIPVSKSGQAEYWATHKLTDITSEDEPYCQNVSVAIKEMKCTEEIIKDKLGDYSMQNFEIAFVNDGTEEITQIGIDIQTHSGAVLSEFVFDEDERGILRPGQEITYNFSEQSGEIIRATPELEDDICYSKEVFQKYSCANDTIQN